MKTKFFTLVAATLFGLLATVSQVNAQQSPDGGSGSPGGAQGQPGIDFKIGIAIAPNPAVDDVTITTTIPKQQSGPMTIAVYNAAGDVMYSMQCLDCGGKSARTISVKDWAAGLYYVRVTYLTKTQTTKLVVVK